MRSAVVSILCIFLASCALKDPVQVPAKRPPVSAGAVQASAKKTGEAIARVKGSSERASGKVSAVVDHAGETSKRVSDLQAKLEEAVSRGEAGRRELQELGGWLALVHEEQELTEAAATEAAREMERLKSEVTGAEHQERQLQMEIVKLEGSIEEKNQEAEGLRVGLEKTALALSAEKDRLADVRARARLLGWCCFALLVLIGLLILVIYLKAKVGLWTGGMLKI